jgi:hypothetical protein
MSKYRVFVEGRNVEIASGERIVRHGFFTARFVEAENAQIAEEKAKALIMDELREYILNAADDMPVLVVEETVSVQTFGDQRVPGKGFTWFEEGT